MGCLYDFYITGLMFQFDIKSYTWIQMKLEQRSEDSKSYIPAERAFHSAEVLGMV